MFNLKRIIPAFLAVTLISATAHAETIYENITEETVIRGITHQSIDALYDTGWLRADVLTVDLTDEAIKLKVLTSPDGTSSLATVKTMAEENNTKAAINADFFNVGSGETNMLGMVYQDGELISTPSTDNFVSFAITEHNEVIFDYFTFTGKLYAENTSLTEYAECELYQINKVPVTSGGITMITSAWGDGVTVPDYTYSIVCEKGEEDDTYVMTNFSWGAEKLAIPEGGAVFVTNYSINAFLNQNFAIGDTIRVEASVSPDIEAIREASGGNTLIVKDGAVCDFTSNITGNAQRSGMGISEDGNTLFLVTVDGRQSDFAGFTQTDLANFMISLGAYTAINLDGGGSTTMVVSDRDGNQNITNSVTVQRKVSTAIGVISDIEPTNEVLGGEIELSKKTLVPGDNVNVNLSFFDENFTKSEVDISKLSFSCTDKKAKINGNVITLYTPGVHRIEAEYDGIVLSSSVRVLDEVFAINIYPEVINTASSNKQVSATAYDTNGYSALIPAHLVTYTTTGDITLENSTVLKGSGTGTVTAHYNSLTSSSIVNGEKYQREEDIRDKDFFEGTIINGEEITITGKIAEPKNFIGQFQVRNRLSELLPYPTVYALSSIYDPKKILSDYIKTDSFTESVIEDTRIITFSNTAFSFQKTDSTAWTKFKHSIETMEESNLIIMTNYPIYDMSEGEQEVFRYYMDLLVENDINVFVVSTGEKSEATVENGVRYIYLGSVGSCTNKSYEYGLNASSTLTFTFAGNEIRYRFN